MSAQLRLDTLLSGDVAGDLGCAGDLAPGVADRRDGEGNVDPRPILALADRLVMIDPFTTKNAPDDDRLLVVPVLGNEERHRPADDFVRAIAEDSFRPSVPARDDAVQILADDPVFR